MKKKIFAILILCTILLLALIGCDYKPERRQISTGDDNKLTTLVLTDIRFDGSAADSVRERMISSVVSERKPEFIAIAGNIVNAENNGEIMKKAVEFIDGLGVPWAASIGELDVKGKTSKKGIMNILTNKKLKNSMVMRGYNYEYNYVLEIVDYKNKVNNLLYFVDTSVECSDTFVEWYKNTITNLSFKFQDVQGQLLNSRVFMNRPLPIYADNLQSDTFEVHAWGNSIDFQKAVIDLKSTKNVIAGFDDLANGAQFKHKEISFAYSRSMLFASSMQGDLYRQQQVQTGCIVCEFSDSSITNINQIFKNPNNSLQA